MRTVLVLVDNIDDTLAFLIHLLAVDCNKYNSSSSSSTRLEHLCSSSMLLSTSQFDVMFFTTAYGLAGSTCS